MRLSIAGAIFLVESAAFRLGVYRPSPDGRLVITMFDAVPLTLVVDLEEADDQPSFRDD